MAIEELRQISIFRPYTVRRDKDADEHRRDRRGRAPSDERDERDAEADEEKGNVDIKV